MNFIPENELERALMEAATQEAARPEFYRLLLESELLALGEIVSGDAAAGIAQPGTKIRFQVARREGREYILLFTARQRLTSAIGGEQPYVRMFGRDLFEAAPGACFFLNPGAPYGKELLPDEVAHLVSPPAQEEVRYFKDHQVTIEQPKVQPLALLQALCALFETRPEVEAAYVAQIAGLPGMEPHPLLGIETTRDWAAVSAAVGDVVSNGRFGHIVDIVPIERGNAGATLSNNLLAYPPFYRRTGAPN